MIQSWKSFNPANHGSDSSNIGCILFFYYIYCVMRLLPKEIEFIKSTILGRVPGAEVFIFGSRTHDRARGGDIDILIISEDEVSLEENLRIKIDLKEKLGDQKIDLICQTASHLSPFAELMKTEGVRL
ncbi:MAG: nucleotidyltransferase domain-containing protein [Bacteroidota bacterium]|nr:nucleotidyltransferase domain-containing protein [Bacteroidota bacterium]